MMRMDLCLCRDLKPVQTQSRVWIFMHVLEIVTSTNTARLAHLSLKNSALRIRGRMNEPTDWTDVFSGNARPLLLYPSEEAIELTPEWCAQNPGPYSLIVPDGSWRQASKFFVRESKSTPALLRAQHVKLPPGPLSEYPFRREPHPESVCTFEAIARALGVLEGAQVQADLEISFKLFVNRILKSRGQKV